MNLNSVLCGYLLLSFIGCGSAQPEQPENQTAQSYSKSPDATKRQRVKEPEFLALIREFAQELRASGIIGSTNTLDVWGLMEDFHETAMLVLTEQNVHRLDAFITELSNDEAGLENIIAVKNAFLEPSNEGTCLYPAGQAAFLEKLATPEGIELILTIRDGLYGSDGQLLKEILLWASQDEFNKSDFLAGQILGKCIDEYLDTYGNETQNWWISPEHHCASQHLAGVFMISLRGQSTNLRKLGATTLKQNLRKLAKFIGEEGDLDDKELTWAMLKLIPVMDYQSLDFLRDLVKNLTAKQLQDYLLKLAIYLREPSQEKFQILLSKSEENIHRLVPELFEYYTNMSLKNLDKNQLRELLRQLGSHKKSALLFVEQATYRE